MNELKRNKFNEYFATRVSYFKEQAKMLTADDRADEAVFAKIQMNVYDIFQTIFSVAIKTAGQDDQKAVQFLMTKLREIPANWQAALEKAEAHGEEEKAHIERVKLDAVGEIKNKVTEIWEETT